MKSLHKNTFSKEITKLHLQRRLASVLTNTTQHQQFFEWIKFGVFFGQWGEILWSSAVVHLLPGSFQFRKWFSEKRSKSLTQWVDEDVARHRQLWLCAPICGSAPRRLSLQFNRRQPFALDYLFSVAYLTTPYEGVSVGRVVGLSEGWKVKRMKGRESERSECRIVGRAEDQKVERMRKRKVRR